MLTRVFQDKPPRRRLLALFVVGAAAAALFGIAVATIAANPAADIDQCRNGGIATPQTFTQCTGAAWQNGNAGAQNSHYREGESISYRTTVTNLTAGDQVVLVLGYDVIHSGKDAIDYLTSNDRWQPPETTSGATPDVPASGSPTLANIPAPTTNINVNPALPFGDGTGGCQNGVTGVSQPLESFNALPLAERQMEFYGVSGTPTIVYVGPSPVLTAKTGDQEQQIQLTFTASASAVTISWGGHIGSRLDWGCSDGPRSAGGISGSPYHMRNLDLEVNGINFNLGNQDRSLSAAAVLVPPNVALSKTPSVTDVCNGSSTTVTYTYVVTNSGTVPISGTVVDDNGTPGSPGDDVTVGTYTNLAASGTATFTQALAANGTRTNIATTTATAGGLTATATASATVTGHDCTISLTKTPDIADVCNGSSTTVTYTYVVTNTGDFFSVSGTIADDQVAGVPGFGPIAPGGSQTVTATDTVSGTVTNNATATGTFTDAVPTTATATASATVTGHVCTISLTKTPDIADVCNGSSTTVTYTYVVTNTGDFFSVSGTIADDQVAGVPGFGPIAPGGSQTVTATDTVSGTVTNNATATGTFTDAVPTTATATASATVTGHDCTISLTKTPDIADVCNGSSTTVTYTYVVTNTGDFFSVSGTIADDQVAGVPGFGPIAPGGSQTVTATDTVSGTVTNNATATGTFTDAVPTTATATASATVTGHDCTISLTKTPDIADVCNGSSTTVTYTYVVTNTGDFFSVSGTIADDQVAGVPGFGPIAPGGSQTVTATDTVSGTVTNNATATGTFTDAVPTTATATASATVTGHVCTISLTKTPDIADVCNGSSTTVTYTYVVTNTGDFFSVSGTIADDQVAGVPGFGPIAPGGSQTVTATDTVSGTVTNNATATGTFTDAVPTTATATASATVTGHDCTISLTKTPSTTEVCAGENTQVTYTYVVTNNSDFFDVSGSIADVPLGSIGNFGPLGPGASATLTKVATINATTTNTGTATGTFIDSVPTTATATASATVTAVDCGGNIFHTGTTCEQFHLGAPPEGLAGTELSQVNYKVRANLITNGVNPGVFFYYTSFTAPSDSFTVNIVQSIPAGEGFSTFFAIHQDGTEIRIFNDDCSGYSGGATVTNGSGQAQIVFNQSGIAGQTFVISVKYDKSAHVGVTQPPDLFANGRDVQYNWETQVDGTTVDFDPDGLLFHKT